MSKFMGSSITKKLVMALAGIFLLLFLPVHLGINFLLLNEDPVPFNEAAHFMATFPPIKIFEVVLLLTFLIHIVWGIILQIQNWMARPVGYKVTNYSQTSFFSKFMIYTGGIVLIFLVIHFINFYLMKLGMVEGDPENFYKEAHDLFQLPGYLAFYLFSFVILGFHLHHAFQSAFQTLGWNHHKYTPAIKAIGLIYSIIIPLGFFIIPILIYLK
ncbi:MAG: succinate dehydrogenase [Bacteroidetes bacterium]|nr:MAG: succinate dehydrogenase [Bacteroidota bacterium]